MPLRKTPIHSLARRAFVLAAAGALAACVSQPEQVKTLPQKPAFIRPASGAILTRFDGKRNKGIDIAGSAGDPVLATADGRVVYVGDALRGYGKMLIVKHNDTFISAYAHNQAILVRENDVVRQGQKIAEMGSSGTDRVKLHFELRKSGDAVNPEPYLQGKLH